MKEDQDTPERRSGGFDDKEEQKANFLKSPQKDVNIQPVLGCKIRMLVRYGKDDKNERHYYHHKKYSDDASYMAFDLSKFYNTQDGRTRDVLPPQKLFQNFA